jgi:hypothetical protein
MGRKFGSYEEKVWGDPPMRRFHKPQPSFRKGKLPSPTNGTTLVDYVGL